MTKIACRTMQGKTVFLSVNGTVSIGQPYGRKNNNNLNPYFTPCTEINFTWIVNLNIRDKTIRVLKDNKYNVSMTLDRQKFPQHKTQRTQKALTIKEIDKLMN